MTTYLIKCLDTDPKYKKYSAAIDRALTTWDKNEEWADYISFLGKLHKALRSYTFPTIPRSSLVAVRLGQCLQSDLPSGVHQKALELYSTVFSILGENLSNEIDIWIPGIIPLMPYASINVKPILIELFNTHILPLKTLRHLVLPLLYSLLPGIDDESNESFDAVLQLLDNIKKRVNDDSHFWQCFFLVIINSSDRRLGALVWANRRLPKFNSTLSSNADPPTDKTTGFQALSYEAQTAIIPETGLLIRAFCKGLEDDQLLVQRGFLELLVKNIELHSPALQFVTSPKDLELLVLSACSTVLRRDMSLNRRLWNWLLGPDMSSTDLSSGPNLSREAYFIKNGRDSLVNGLLSYINSDTNSITERCRPYRICLSIMDRWEIGASVVPSVFTPIIKSVKRCEFSYDEHYYTEVLKSAGAFFDGVETITIWSDCVKLIQEKTDESLSLLIFILQSFNVEEEEMIVQQLPLILILLIITEVPPSPTGTKLQLIQLLLNLIPDRAFLPLFIEPENNDQDENLDDEAITQKITSYYQSQPDEADKLPFSSAQLTKILQNHITQLTVKNINEKKYDMAGHYSVFLAQFLQKIHHHESKWRDDSLVLALQTLSLEEDYNYKFVSDVNNLFITIIDGLTTREIENFLTAIVTIIWRSLITVSGTREVEAVKSLWQLQEAFQDRRIEACIASLFVNSEYSAEERGRALSALWNHSSERSNADVILNRCIFLVLEYLRKPSSIDYLVAQHWVEQVFSSGSVNRLLSFITSPILNTQFIHRETPVFLEEDDLDVFSYQCETLLAVIKSHPLLKQVFIREFIPMEHTIAFVVHNENLKGKDSTYAILIKHAILRLFSFEIPESSHSDDEFFKTYESILSVCLDLLNLLVENTLDDILEITEVLMQLLKKFNSHNNAKNLSEIRIIELLSHLLKDLNELGPFGKNQISSNLDTSVQADPESEKKNETSQRLEKLSKDLVNSLIEGFASNYDLYVVEAWTSLLADCVPLFGEVILQVLLPLVESLTNQISKNFTIIKKTYEDLEENKSGSQSVSLSALFSYMKALEKLLAAAHKQLTTSNNVASGKPTTEPGFFGAVMSGVFTVESPIARSTAANNRLTVLLSFQDTIQGCFEIWSWVEENNSLKTKSQKVDSHMYHSARLKFWTRKIMESLYNMETMETLEMFIEIGKSSPYIFKILHGLDGSKPKSTIPHLFNSLISRVNPSSVDLKERSTLTSDLSDVELMSFLVDYLKSLENDAVEDIWNESIGFLREIQASNTLYRHLMPDVFRFIAVLAKKVDTLSFGEQRRIRRDLSDVFIRLFNTVLSSRSIVAASDASGLAAETEQGSEPVLSNENDSTTALATTSVGKTGNALHENLAASLIDVVPSLGFILNDNDKITTSLTTIVANFIAPAAKSKAFPSSFSQRLTTLLLTVMSQPGSQKAWKTSIGDIIFDQRFMNMNPIQSSKWKDITQKWAQSDKDRLQDYINRLLSHGSNSNVLFGWSDQEATYTHRNINRLSFIFLSGSSDGYMLNIKSVTEKLEEIMSSETVADTLRNEVFTCLRAIILRVDPTHLSTIWTFVYSELYKTFTMVFSIYQNGEVSTEQLAKQKIFLKGLVSACKLLDMLLILGLEDFNP